MSIKDLINKAKETEDQSVASTGGEYEYVPPAAGVTYGRFIEYIELGKQPESYNGVAKSPVDNVRVTFELLNPAKNIREIEVDGGTKKIADRISVTMSKKSNEKAKFFKLFKAMAAGRENITHIAEMLGEAFLITVTHNDNGKTGKDKRVYANIYNDQVWSVGAPRVVDPLAGTSTDISSKVPEALSPLRIFLWNNPTKETWDSLFIDGTTEIKKEDGSVEQRSKNWLQELILSAKDYNGSALDQMLNNVADLPTGNPQAEEEAQERAAIEGAQAAKQEEPVKNSDDLLAEMGLG